MTGSRTEIRPQDYLRVNFQPSDRLAILVRNHERGETMQRITTAGRVMEPSFERWLHFKNDREGFDVYVGMNPLKPSARTRTKQDILAIRHLYVDLDQDGAVSLAAIERSDLVPAPNYVLFTSPGKFQVVWRVENVATEQAEALLRAMARRFGGDPAVTDSTRVLRMPGFANKKYDEHFVVKADQRSDRVHQLADFRLQIDHVDSPYQPVRHNPSNTPPTEPRRLSQSEHDWAFAKRAIARGGNLEDIIRSIAQFREDDKDDSLGYARRTVGKAKAQLEEGLGRIDQDKTSESAPLADSRPRDP